MDQSVDAIDSTVRKTYDWLREIRRRGDLRDLREAYRVLRAVLHALRDRLEPTVAAHVAAQLPMLVRGLFYEGWVPARTPLPMSMDAFLERVEKEAGLKGTSAAEDAIRAVMTVCEDQLGEGTVSHLLSALPDDFVPLMWQ